MPNVAQEFKAEVSATHLELLKTSKRSVMLYVTYQKPEQFLVEDFRIEMDDELVTDDRLKRKVHGVLERTHTLSGSILPGDLVTSWENLQPEVEQARRIRNTITEQAVTMKLNAKLIGRVESPFQNIPFARSRKLLDYWSKNLDGPITEVAFAVTNSRGVTERIYYHYDTGRGFDYNRHSNI